MNWTRFLITLAIVLVAFVLWELWLRDLVKKPA